MVHLVQLQLNSLLIYLAPFTRHVKAMDAQSGDSASIPTATFVSH